MPHHLSRTGADMSESNTQANVHPLREANSAMITHAVTAGFDLTERALQSTLELIEATRRELFQVTVASIDWVEANRPSPAKIVRETIGRLDKLSEDAIAG